MGKKKNKGKASGGESQPQGGQQQPQQPGPQPTGQAGGSQQQQRPSGQGAGHRQQGGRGKHAQSADAPGGHDRQTPQSPPQQFASPPGQQGPPERFAPPPGQQGPPQRHAAPPGPQGPPQKFPSPPRQQGPPQRFAPPPGQQGAPQRYAAPPGPQAQPWGRGARGEGTQQRVSAPPGPQGYRPRYAPQQAPGPAPGFAPQPTPPGYPPRYATPQHPQGPVPGITPQPAQAGYPPMYAQQPPQGPPPGFSPPGPQGRGVPTWGPRPRTMPEQGQQAASPPFTPDPSPSPSSQATLPSRETSMSPEQDEPQEKQRADQPPKPSSPQETPVQGAVPKQPKESKAAKKRGRKKQEGGDAAPPASAQTPTATAAEPPKRDQGETGEAKKTATINIKYGGGVVPIIEPQERGARREGGKICRKKINVLTNHFPLSLGKLNRAIHYDVTITPDKPKKLFRAVMETFRVNNYENRFPAFDGVKNLYSAYSLCPNELTGKVKVTEDDREREFEVKIKQVAYVDLSCLKDYFHKIGTETLDKPMQALQCIDIILRSAPSLNCIPVGRSYFNIPVGDIITLGDGTELFNGFYQSAILGWKPFLNVDVAHKAFPMQMAVVDYIREISRSAHPRDPLHPRDSETLQKHIKNLKVHYELPKMPGTKRIWRVNGLGDQPNRATFRNDRGELSTVERYFLNEKRIRLQYPNWPTLWVGSPNRENKILLPLEFCTIIRGQVINRKLTENQTRNMIREAATSAPTRLSKIQKSVEKAKYNYSPSVNEFGISVSEQPQEVQARVLEPPTLLYARSMEEKVSRGVWRGKPFQTGVSIQKWTIICVDGKTDVRNLDRLEQLLIASGRKFGVQIHQAMRDNGRDFLFMEENYKTVKFLKQNLVDYFKSAPYELIVVVVPDNSKTAYPFVKQAAELVSDKLTQCVRARTLQRINPTTTDNIMLKINAKLNGVNHILGRNFQPSCFKEPIVIMGADVTHPSPDAQNIPSVVAVTCSYDMNGFKYIFSWRLQEPKLEIIKDLEAIVMEQLRYFKQRNNCAPQRIIFFRDGVSDGQFPEVRSSELRAIRNACSKLNVNYKPKISFFVVQKRHHTRLFPVNKDDSEDKNLNVPAGTCVDTVITHPTVYDFYLVSHASIQGVAKPTKYVPLWDDADMNEDEIQHLTFYLCHLFARCNRSVSYPTPTYYAHLAAARAKVYIETENIDMTRLEIIQEKLQANYNIIRRLPMFFV